MSNPYELILEPGRAERQYWRDLWRYRELFYILAWRDVSVRYKQTLIGAAWTVIQPLLTMVVMTVVFDKVAGLPSEGDAPYSLMVFAGMLPWMFFSTSLSTASQSLVANSNLISKVYFPRMIVPAAAVITALVDFLISFVILAAMMAWYRFLPDGRIAALPLLMVLAFFGGGRAGAVDCGHERQVPRFPLRDSVPRAVRSLRLARGLQRFGHPPPLRRRGLCGLLAESDGGRDRRLPLGDPGRRGRGLLARLRDFLRRGSGAAVRRHSALPQHREDLRGRDLARGGERRAGGRDGPLSPAECRITMSTSNRQRILE